MKSAAHLGTRLTPNEITIVLATLLALLMLAVGIHEEVTRQKLETRQPESQPRSDICDKPFKETWVPLRLELSYSRDCMQRQQGQ